MTATIYISGRNCARYVTRSLLSLTRQTWQDFHVVFVDDASTDDTAAQAREVLSRHFAGRHRLVVNPAPQGKAANAFELLGRDGSEFTAILDADDELIHDGALAQMADAYARGYDIVWTQYVTDDGRRGGNGPLDPTRAPRGQRWLTSHFFSFRTELFAQVPAALLQDDDGRWLQCACDFAIAFPLLDQTRRYLHLPIEAYRYTATNPQSHHNQAGPSQVLSSPAQQASARLVLSRPALPCTRPLETHLGSILNLVYMMQAKNTARQISIEEKNNSEYFQKKNQWEETNEIIFYFLKILKKINNANVLQLGGSGKTNKIIEKINYHGGSITILDNAEIESTNNKFGTLPMIDINFLGENCVFFDLEKIESEDAFDLCIILNPTKLISKFSKLPSIPLVYNIINKNPINIIIAIESNEDENNIFKFLSEIPELIVHKIGSTSKIIHIESN